MPDTRPAHMRVSLLNMPTPKYEGAAHSLYGPRGPQQAHNTGRRRASEPPMSLEHHVQDAIAKPEAEAGVAQHADGDVQGYLIHKVGARAGASAGPVL